MLERLQRGAYPSRGVLPDALLIAMRRDRGGRLGARGGRGPAAARARRGARGRSLTSAGVVAPVFAAPGRRATSRGVLALFAVVAPGVPAIAVEEALWTAWDVVEGSD